MAVLCVCFAGMEAKQLLYVSELKPASASLISPEFSRSTHTSAEELIGIRQVSVKLETDQRHCRNDAGAHHAGCFAGEYRIL